MFPCNRAYICLCSNEIKGYVFLYPALDEWTGRMEQLRVITITTRKSTNLSMDVIYSTIRIWRLEDLRVIVSMVWCDVFIVRYSPNFNLLHMTG